MSCLNSGISRKAANSGSCLNRSRSLNPSSSALWLGVEGLVMVVLRRIELGHLGIRDPDLVGENGRIRGAFLRFLQGFAIHLRSHENIAAHFGREEFGRVRWSSFVCRRRTKSIS